ncbi:hypothetical protein OGA32_000102 [Salmonella enterica]|nr:hypothetical protein [Salmonella enterica]
MSKQQKELANLFNANRDLKAENEQLRKRLINQDTMIALFFNDMSKAKLLKEFKPIQQACIQFMEMRKEQSEKG